MSVLDAATCCKGLTGTGVALPDGARDEGVESPALIKLGERMSALGPERRYSATNVRQLFFEGTK